MADELQVQTLIFVLILIVYILSSHAIQVKKIPYLHQSTIAIVLGMITAVIVKLIFQIPIAFSNQFFFTIILPPIIFSAGYSLRKSLFFQNLGVISFLGIIGTLLGFILISITLSLLNSWFFHALNITQILLVSSLLCASDSVAAMALIKPDVYPTLNAVLFGQSIINDAISIILFQTVQSMGIGTTSRFTFETVLLMILKFCYLLVFSLLLGIVTGFAISYLFKVNLSFTGYPIKQTALILLNGYFTYLVAQLCELSGIISLFTCAVIMGHYTFLNISTQAQRGTGLAFQTISYVAEAFVFAYLGASILSVNGQWLAAGMSGAILISFPIIRALMVYFLPCIYHFKQKQFPLNSKQLKVCWYSGMVRGVVAYALCLQIQSPDPNTQELIHTVVMVVVIVTTILGATLLRTFIKCIGFKTAAQQKNQQSLLADSKKSIISDYQDNLKHIHFLTDQENDFYSNMTNRKGHDILSSAPQKKNENKQTEIEYINPLQHHSMSFRKDYQPDKVSSQFSGSVSDLERKEDF